MTLEEQNNYYWKQYTKEASRFNEGKMLQLVNCPLELKTILHGHPYDNYYVYKLPDITLADCNFHYEFLLEYNLANPNVGIYFGCRCITDWGSDHKKAIRCSQKHYEKFKPEIIRTLNATFPNKDFTHRLKITDNANDFTYWPFWITLYEDEDIKQVGLRSLEIIRKIYDFYLTHEYTGSKKRRYNKRTKVCRPITRFTNDAFAFLLEKLDSNLEFNILIEKALKIGCLVKDPILECGYRFNGFDRNEIDKNTGPMGCCLLIDVMCDIMKIKDIPWSAFSCVLLKDNGDAWTTTDIKNQKSNSKSQLTEDYEINRKKIIKIFQD